MGEGHCDAGARSKHPPTPHPDLSELMFRNAVMGSTAVVSNPTQRNASVRLVEANGGTSLKN